MTTMVPVVVVHTHLGVPAAEALVAGTAGMAAELAAEQAGHSPASLELNREQLNRLLPVIGDRDARLAAMAAMGVDVQVVGPMPMHHSWADRTLAAEYSRAVNEGIAAFCAVMPDRFTGLASVPLQHPDLAVDELAHAVKLGLRGVSLSTTVAGRELADPAHEDFWAAVQRSDVAVLIHPWGCSLGSRLATSYLGNIVGQPVETTVALSHIIFSGLLDRYPRLRLCACHGGGYLPTYAGRSDHAWQVRPDARTCQDPPSSYLRRMWFDSLVYTPTALEHLVAVAGADRVVLGTDYPWDMGVGDPVQRVRAAALTEGQRLDILGRTAAGLLRLDTAPAMVS